MSTLRSGSLRNKKTREDVNPMENLSNLADALLVFACGIMLALIVRGGIVPTDLEQVDISLGEEITDSDVLSDAAGAIEDLSSGYEKVGILYKDPVTGKMYMIEGEE